MLTEYGAKGANVAGWSDQRAAAAQAAFYRDMMRRVVREHRYPQIKAYVHWQGNACQSFIGRPDFERAYRELMSTRFFRPRRPHREGGA